MKRLFRLVLLPSVAVFVGAVALLTLFSALHLSMGTLIALLVVGVIYFMPSIVGKSKHNAGAIFVLNLFLGWTFVGWVIALVWACTRDKSEVATT